MDKFETLQEKVNRLIQILPRIKMELETRKLEEQMMDDKPWYLKGEIVARDRAENTVLEEYLDVQRHGKFVPPPADEDAIVEFIKKCIKEQAFDSPVFKSKDKPSQTLKSDAIPTTAQKSLVEDYENLFAKNNILEREQEDPVKREIQAELADLFEQLDALSHLHFVPYKHAPEITVVESKPAFSIEEAGPGVCATSDLLAPEEVCPPRGEILKGPTEVTSTDKRRHRKKLMRIRSKRKAAKADKQPKNKEAAMAKVIKMAHKPGSNIRIV